MIRDVLLVLAASVLAGFLLHRAIPAARACMAPLDTAATYDLTLTAVSSRDATASEEQKETLRWSETATLDADTKTITFADGTALVFE